MPEDEAQRLRDSASERELPTSRWRVSAPRQSGPCHRSVWVAWVGR
ncbi:hypothetical protein HNR68_002907 [Saccharopolyspora hordei]|uniref:Uncharacterized protein n=1 Tax=Saccharopolyspora hordei TaxID=1838 RepID=A0A853ARW6_9PSEU|nr:hypothetical protein [Saccharopolyspora hordei]